MTEESSPRRDGREGEVVIKSPMEKFKDLATRLVAVSRSDLELQREMYNAKDARIIKPKGEDQR